MKKIDSIILLLGIKNDSEYFYDFIGCEIADITSKDLIEFDNIIDMSSYKEGIYTTTDELDSYIKLEKAKSFMQAIEQDYKEKGLILDKATAFSLLQKKIEEEQKEWIRVNQLIGYVPTKDDDLLEGMKKYQEYLEKLSVYSPHNAKEHSAVRLIHTGVIDMNKNLISPCCKNKENLDNCIKVSTLKKTFK